MIRAIIRNINQTAMRATVKAVGALPGPVLPPPYTALDNVPPLILRFDTSLGNGIASVTLPCFNTSTFGGIVDYGDGTSAPFSAYNDAAFTKAYSVGGVYEWKIYGDLPHIYFNNTGDKLKIIYAGGYWKPSSLKASFYGCVNILFDFSMFDTSIVTSIESWVRNTPFNSPIDSLDFSSVTSGAYAFQNTPFNQLLPADMSSLIDLSYMFNNSSFNQPISGTTFGNVTQYVYTFWGCPFDQSFVGKNFSSTLSMNYFNNGSLSTANFSELLIIMSGQTLLPSRTLRVIGVTYDIATAQAAHDDIVINDLWTVIDGGGV